MRRLLAMRWVWTTGLFATINVVGLLWIGSMVRGRTARLTVEAFEPQGETEPEADITIRFNQPMAAQDDVGREVTAALVAFAPTIRGKLSWADERTLAFRPAEKLPMATPFVATVSRKCRSLAGQALAADAAFEFNTPPLRVLRVGQKALSRYSGLSLGVEFNDKVAPDEARGHIVLTGPGGTKVPFWLTSHAPSRTVVLATAQVPEETLRLVVTKGLRGVSGPLGLGADSEWEVKVDAGLRIEAVSARARTPDDVAVSVACNQPLDLEAAAKHIQVEPRADFRVVSDYDGFRLVGAFVPGRRYRITFLAGLAAKNGSELARDVVRSILIPDVEPYIRFRTQGFYLASQGSLLLPLETTNVREVQLTIEQVYPNNVVHYFREPGRDLCRPVRSEKLTFPHKPNERQVVDLDLRKLIGTGSPLPATGALGLYRVEASNPAVRWGERECQLVAITDLGLTVKRSDADLLVWVNALSTARPVEGATVAVLTKANQQVLSGTTDANGLAHFKGVDASPERQPFVVAATKGNDTGFVEVEPARLDDSDFDVSGRPYLASGYEAFIYGDRAIYRPGSKVVLRAIVRGKDATVPQPFPVQFRVQRPDGRLFKTLAAKLNAWGSAEATVEVPTYALTGRYSVELRLPGSEKAIGNYTFQVEDFVPDRMKVTIAAKEGRRVPIAGDGRGEELTFTVKASHLFGSPAADRAVEARCDFVAEQFSHPDFPGYSFSDSSKKFATITEKLGEATLDKDGKREFTVKIPGGMAPPSGLSAIVTASVKELGGRAVTASLAVAVDCYPHYIGLARASKEHARTGAADRLLVVAVKPDGSPVGSLQLEGNAYQVVWNTVLKLQGNSYRFVSEREEKSIEKLTCAVSNGRGEVAFTPPGVGEYVVRLADKASGASADLRFYCAGEGDVPWAMDKPARIELVPDKKAYAPGDTARVLVKAPFPGTALLTVETDRIHHAQVLVMEKNTAEFAFPVTAALAPNAYCSATVVRKASGTPWVLHRAYGAAPLALDNAPRQLKVHVQSPDEARPGKPMRVALRVTDAAGAGRKAEVTLAAVDEGICQLTRYETPDPWGFFFGKRRLGVATADLYSLLMPEPEARKVGMDSAPGGDGHEDGYDPRLINPVAVERVKQVALWRSGIETGDDGKAELMLDVPEFSGQLRLMAVAASASGLGAAERPARIKQPLMVQASFPRFLAPGDEFVVPVTVFNNTGESGNVQLAIKTGGGLDVSSDAPKQVAVESGREATVRISAYAPATPGAATLSVEARLGDETAVESVDPDLAARGKGRGRAFPCCDKAESWPGGQLRPPRRLGEGHRALLAVVLRAADYSPRLQPPLPAPIPLWLRRADHLYRVPPPPPGRCGKARRARA